jgi:hypothetical protein
MRYSQEKLAPVVRSKAVACRLSKALAEPLMGRQASEQVRRRGVNRGATQNWQTVPLAQLS